MNIKTTFLEEHLRDCNFTRDKSLAARCAVQEIKYTKRKHHGAIKMHSGHLHLQSPQQT
jgi:hypothetical protein